EAKRDFAALEDRFVNRHDELERFAALKAIDQRGCAVADRVDHAFQVTQMAEAIDIRRIFRIALHDLGIFRARLGELPGLDRIDGKTADFDRAFLAEKREGTFKIFRTGRGRSLDDTESAVAEGDDGDAGVLGFDIDK